MKHILTALLAISLPHLIHSRTKAALHTSVVNVFIVYTQDYSDVTTYHLAFHLAQMFPQLYAQAMVATKARPGAKAHGASDWGDSLKKAADAGWSARFLRSVYDLMNAEVHPDATGRDNKTEGEAGFFRWLAKQRAYYHRLLKVRH